MRQLSTPLAVPVYTVATLPTTAAKGAIAGALAYASNGRATTGVATLNSGFSIQAAGAGTGTLVSYNGTVWQIAGTNVTVSA